MIEIAIKIVTILIQIGVVEYDPLKYPCTNSDWKRHDFKIVTLSICVVNLVEYGLLK